MISRSFVLSMQVLGILKIYTKIVLAKNLLKGEIVGYLYVGLIIAKTNIHSNSKKP